MGRRRPCPPCNPGRHELILLSVAGKIAIAELGHRINAEYVVRPDVDRVGNIVAPAAAIAVLTDGIAAASVLENISIHDCLVSRVSANLDGEAASVEHGVAFDDDGF